MAESGGTLAIFLSDLRLVGTAGALALYLLWSAWPRPGIAALGRISLAVTALCAVLLSVVGDAPYAPIRDTLVLGVLGLFLVMSAWFSIAPLGILVSLMVLFGISWPEWAPAAWGQFYGAPRAGADVSAYWGRLRDILGSLALVAAVLCLQARLATGLFTERRTGGGLASLDVQHAGQLLARLAAPLFLLAVGAGSWSVYFQSGLRVVEGLRLAGLVILGAASLTLLFPPSGRQRRRKLLQLVLALGLGSALWMAAPQGAPHLTPTGIAP
ncbi:MAG: hypothetical protein VKP62_07265 [Candidatus Sericytochromatia bacterium]|nr:hypothetical protein [Candidatus Sericytochromatia bacterium]